MKFNRILSSALLVVMLFAAIVVAIPINADAAYTNQNSATAQLTEKQIEAAVKAAYNYRDFESAEEMLEYEKNLGYLDEAQSGNFKIYVNKYTGVLYYQNTLTGQILTSNPYYYSTDNGDQNIALLSQITISYSEIATGSKPDRNSTEWAALRSQISTNFIKDGIRVNYTIGDTTSRYLLPGRMKASKFEELVLTPMLEEFVALMEANCAGEDYNGEYNIFENPDYLDESLDDKEARKKNYIYLGYYNKDVIKKYLTSMKGIFDKLPKNSQARKQLLKVYNDITDIYTANENVYTIKNPARYEPGTTLYENMIKEYYTGDGNLEIYETLEPMYVFSTKATPNDKSNRSIIFREYVTGYTYTDMFRDEAECGYVDNAIQKPVFRCSIEYSINDDGSLSVRLPASSISFDETVYTLDSITLLKYFGAGNTTEDGYIFFPDGSGTVVEFRDFHDVASDSVQAATATVNVFGQDYCYSEVTGAHREQISMPVFGVVSTEKANKVTADKYGVSTVKNGYFAIMEDGASLATLSFETGGAAYDFGHAYCSYKPYPSDTYEFVSAGNTTSYTMVSESKFNGSYVTKYVMLTDDTVGSLQSAIDPTYSFYNSSYVGMANYYRDYLTKNGTISAIEDVKKNLPLYIEVLGSMEITDKFLSFPVTKSIALTEFDDVLKMYEELYNSKSVFEEQAAEYERLAAETADEALKAEYLAIAKGYREFVIDNVNFRLTGFGNGGLYATYPTKLRWNRACGGKRAYRELLLEAEEIAKKGQNLGIFPEYDFMYINHSESFDGVSSKKNASKMIDNRYASKQVYDSVSAEYVTYFSLVVNSGTLDDLYTKFAKKYGKYNNTGISVSTMGSDLNSNFDDDEPINRDDSQANVEGVLDRMSKDYDVMLDIGNIYTIKYATHILNVSIDSSHFRYSSYAIPFVGMVLHGSVSYAGNPINYSGNPSYDILRSIESGAALYYILCYQNANYLKEDSLLNDYYGIDYTNWYDNIVKSYKTINDAIGDLQNYTISGHEIIIGERVIEEKEQIQNYKTLMNEIIDMLDKAISDKVYEGYLYLLENETGYTRKLSVSVDRDALMIQFGDVLNISKEELEAFVIDDSTFGALVDGVIAKHTAQYPAVDANDYVVSVSSIDYDSQYSFITDSVATDKENYVYTDFTSDKNIVLVTYTNSEGKSVQFILNYNIYSVNVILENGETYTLGKHEFVRIG